MRTYNNLFEKVVSIENVKLAILNASKKKRKRNDVAYILEHIDEEAEKVRKMLIEERYTPGHGKPHRINDNNSKKERTIVKPHFAYDQIVHHAVIQILEPVFLKGMYEYVAGSVPKRGAHGTAARMMKWSRGDIKGTKYCLKCDIRHFYASVDKDILRGKLAKRIRDKKLLRLIFTIIESGERGLPLGYYTSQWFANFLLQDLDYYIKQEVKALYYVRYADDIVIYGPNKKELHRIQTGIESYFHDRLHLRMKRNWQVFRTEFIPKKDGKSGKPEKNTGRHNARERTTKPTGSRDRNAKPTATGEQKAKPDGDKKKHGRKLDFMGFQMDHEYLTLRKSAMLAATRKAKKIWKKKQSGKPITWYDATSMLSHLGKIKHTDTRHMYGERIKPYIEVKRLKKLVSKHTRKEKERERIAMEAARGLSGRKAA